MWSVETFQTNLGNLDARKYVSACSWSRHHGVSSSWQHLVVPHPALLKLHCNGCLPALHKQNLCECILCGKISWAFPLDFPVIMMHYLWLILGSLAVLWSQWMSGNLACVKDSYHPCDIYMQVSRLQKRGAAQAILWALLSLIPNSVLEKHLVCDRNELH